MNFRTATASYEDWLAKKLEVVSQDATLKHETMEKGVFVFMRATFYRFAQLWPDALPDCNKAPSVLAVGDLHVENFGTWRDAEGRLVWGVNDFDEVYPLPYTIDLVRLALSAHLAISQTAMEIDHREACEAVLTGYRAGLEAGGRPFVLEEKHRWMRDLVATNLRDPVTYWEKLKALPEFPGRVPKQARKALERMMPDARLGYRLAHRVAGLGSLGRQRFVALAEHAGGLVCREAKALAPSACVWALPQMRSERIRYQQALDTAVRAVDPFVKLNNKWIVRRLAPDCSKVDLASIPREKDEGKLLSAMGWETANVHLGSSKAGVILKDLAARPKHWLHECAEEMVRLTTNDWNEWRKKAGNPKRAVKHKKK